MKFSVCNLGCKVNAYEAEAIASDMEKKGWQRVPFEEPADLVVICTCAVTNTAAAKSRKMMHRAKKINPDCAVAVTGCYTEVNDGMLDDAEMIIGTREKENLAAYAEQYFRDHVKIRKTGNLEHIPFDSLKSEHFENRTRAFLKIQDGCNQFCSYCVIPYVRGRERSMAPDDVITEAKRIAEDYPEIVLAGIHTGRYGREYGVTLAQLMKRILCEVPKLQRLRISSIEETEIDDEMLELIAKETRIARHLHIPLQAGSDSVLKRMHRPYTTKEYLAKIEAVRRAVPDISISCDVIVGFPQESEEEFQETYDFIRECRFSFLHVFPYSLRRGTAAAEMDGQIDPRVKKERAEKLLALSDELYSAYQKTWVGKYADVIAETEEDGCVKGHSSAYFPVYLEAGSKKGKMYHAYLKEYRNGRLFGSREGEENETE